MQSRWQAEEQIAAEAIAGGGVQVSSGVSVVLRKRAAQAAQDDSVRAGAAATPTGSSHGEQAGGHADERE